MVRFFLVLLLTTFALAKVRYDNHVVYQIIPQTVDDLRKIDSLRNRNLQVDFWKGLRNVNLPVDIMVSSKDRNEFLNVISELNLKAKMSIHNVQGLIDQNKPRVKRMDKQFDFNEYHRLNTIYDYLEELSMLHPHARLITVGRSYEGRLIKGMKVSFRPGNKAVFIEGGMHAAEWISPSTVLYLLTEVLNKKDSKIRDMAESYDWYFVPCINPDGYEYSHTQDRLWRKTRKPYGVCYGADGNRNWDFHWNETGTSGQCGSYYPGTHPFSEPEMLSLSKYINKIAKDLVVYISFHNYGQLILVPYAYGKHVDNYNDLITIGNMAAKSLTNRNGTDIIVGNWAETMYFSSGVSVDWVKAKHKVPITYTIELRDRGHYGFVLPNKFIIPVGDEILYALVTIIQEAKSREY